MPTINIRHGLVLRNKEIIACGGQVDYNCFIYFIANNSWTIYRTAGASNLPYTVYNQKLYFSGGSGSSLVLDLTNNTWSTWPLAPINNAGSCQVPFRDGFIRFGGTSSINVVLKFNHTTQNWTTLASNAPNSYFSGCTLFTNDKVLLVGHGAKYNVYDLISNQWIYNGTLFTTMMNMGVVTLGNRIFILQGPETKINIVQEFNPIDYSFTNVSYRLQQIRDSMAAVAVPAKLFRALFPTCMGVS